MADAFAQPGVPAGQCDDVIDRPGVERDAVVVGRVRSGRDRIRGGDGGGVDDGDVRQDLVGAPLAGGRRDSLGIYVGLTVCIR